MAPTEGDAGWDNPEWGSPTTGGSSPVDTRPRGSTPGWLPPIWSQIGTSMLDTATQKIPHRFCGGVHGDKSVDPGALSIPFVSVIQTLHGNHLNTHLDWAAIEPVRPQGGNPALGAGNGETRNYNGSGILAAVDNVLSWADANGIVVVINSSGTKVGNYFTGSSGQNGWPTWLYDDTQWTGADVPANSKAPLPADRAHYGGAYPATAGAPTSGQQDALTAQWAPSTDTVTNLGNVNTWGGDWTKFLGYYAPFIQQLVNLGSKHPCVIGYKFLNEPELGNLGNAVNASLTGGTELGSVNYLLSHHWQLFDPIRAVEPQRFICFSGHGGNNMLVAPDFSKLYTKGVGGVAGPIPLLFPFMLEAHWYAGLWQTPPGVDPQDTWDGGKQGAAPDPTTYSPTAGYANTIAGYWGASAQAWGVPILFGELGIGNNVTNNAQWFTDMETAINSVGGHFSYFSMSTAADRTPPSSGMALLTKTSPSVYAPNPEVSTPASGVLQRSVL